MLTADLISNFIVDLKNDRSFCVVGPKICYFLCRSAYLGLTGSLPTRIRSMGTCLTSKLCLICIRCSSVSFFLLLFHGNSSRISIVIKALSSYDLMTDFGKLF